VRLTTNLLPPHSPYLISCIPFPQLHVAALPVLFYGPDEIHVKSGVTLAVSCDVDVIVAPVCM
jgi:hypothetical protein